ncbi:MAG: 4-hydroxy-3-methylbut-2-enyl diphosphate reductase [Planctomycetota bacterium]|nr:MAG: 4-hydroxy-3-methylbut-2-enyl diphosphate reductase [Planctomycetota bacterium]
MDAKHLDQDGYGEASRYTYRNELVDQLRQMGSLEVGRLTLRLPREFGFCWGVDRALAMVEEARRRFPGRPMWLLNSIIHNPKVNADMGKLGIRFLKGPKAEAGALDSLGPQDVVIVPAFSAEVEEIQFLKDRGVEVVDTTCPWVIKPHKRTQKYIREGFTTIIHGTVGHDETRSTCSLVRHHGGQFVVVHDLQEAEALALYLEGEIDGDRFQNRLHDCATPEDFVPERDLQKIGLINQTTMLASESRAIADRLRLAFQRRGGEAALEKNFRDFDTICRATQDNQDAATEVVAGGVQLFLVVGGYDSSNTRNLARVGDAQGVASFHIEGPECIHPGWIQHRDRDSGEILTAENWLPAEGRVTVAFTAGASTPDAILGRVMERVAEVAGCSETLAKET